MTPTMIPIGILDVYEGGDDEDEEDCGEMVGIKASNNGGDMVGIDLVSSFHVICSTIW